MKTGLTLILVGHINFILGAIVHGSVLRHISNPTDHITTEYTLANIISVTSGLLVSLWCYQCHSCKAEHWWTLRLNNCCMHIRTLPLSVINIHWTMAHTVSSLVAVCWFLPDRAWTCLLYESWVFKLVLKLLEGSFHPSVMIWLAAVKENVALIRYDE